MKHTTDPHRSPSGQSPGATANRRSLVDWLALLLLLVVLGLGWLSLWRWPAGQATLASSWLPDWLPGWQLAAPAAEATVPALTQTEQAAQQQALARGQALLATETAGSWPVWLASGQRGLDEYLVRLFTAPAYLARGATDDEFIRDASQVINGTIPDDAAQAAAAGLLAASGSRLELLAQLVKAQGWSFRLDLPAEPTLLVALKRQPDLPADQATVIGKLAIQADCQLTGQSARVRLFSDGRLHTSAPASALQPADDRPVGLYWDTRQERPGTHALALLIQTSDGRGRWLDLASWYVPEMASLPAGQLVSDQLAGANAARAGWYQIDTSAGPAALTILAPSAALDLTLFDLDGQVRSRSAALAGEPAALRWPSPDGQGVAYIHLAPAEPTADGPLTFRLVQAVRLAAPLAEPDQWQVLLKEKDETWLVQAADGKQQWVQADDYQQLDLTARLAGLRLATPITATALPADGTPAEQSDIRPDFDREVSRYGLYVPAATSELSLALQASEGSAASLSLTCQVDDGPAQPVNWPSPVPLAPSVNTLTITVTGYNGETRDYVLTVLRPPARDGYEAVLEAFPLSYRSSLWQLHLERPSYVFQADPTGIDWTTLLDAQDYKSRSLVEADSSPSSWVEAGSPVYDGADWKAAARPLIAYLADPRNFLNGTDVFQFESLQFVPALHQKAGIEAMLADTFMAPGNREQIDYAALFLQAGETAQISPFFLAAKVIQEMGRQGQSPLAFGTLDGYVGYYNFYNIGATPNPSVKNGAQINGARFAQYGAKADEQIITEPEAAWLLPWTNPERAIVGGALWIAQGYVAIGQDTLYLQKFDLIAAGGLFNHQYAQNIQMARAEGRRVFRNYQALDLLDQPFSFRIPIYTDMPPAASPRP